MSENGLKYQALLVDALEQIDKMEAALAGQASLSEPLAVVGLSCRFPGGANTPEAFWDMLINGVDSATVVPAERWDMDRLYDPRPGTPGRISSRHGCFVDGVDQFDPEFFGISPREASAMDPQQRLLVEETWSALERAGIAPASLLGRDVGVFIGLMGQDYSRIDVDPAFERVDGFTGVGNAPSVAAGRIAYLLGTQGPAMTIDTACSSSLVAVHQACQSLRLKECELAIAGGVNLLLSPFMSVAESASHMLSPDGRCKTFDAAANGIVRADGCGVVVLKRLSDALAAHDPILAVIRGSAVGHDGASGGLTVPNGPAQEKVLRQALGNAGVRPDEVSYLEAHGTGTSLGDPIEVGALGEVFKSKTAAEPLMIGSVKTNIGHTEGAAGVAGLIKTVLSMTQRQIPPHLHFSQPNPFIAWNELPLRVVTKAEPWRVAPTAKRIAGVSAFGLSGTNAHVIVEEAPLVEKRANAVERPAHLLCLSAKSEAALQALVERYRAHLPASTEALGDICYTANAGRSHFKHRLAFAAADKAQLLQKLQESNLAGGPVQGGAPRQAWLFSGQGSQYAGMGKQLYDTEPVFRGHVDQCAKLLEAELDLPLVELLWGSHTAQLGQTRYTQPALFALEYALGKLWQSWGLAADVVLGHSVGEYAAACLAGVFSLEDGVRLIGARARLMHRDCAPGAMLAILAEAGVVEAMLRDFPEVDLAARNGAANLVAAGSVEAIDALEREAQRLGLVTKRLTVSHAFHSRLMEPMLDAFRDVARQVTLRAPAIRYISSMTGGVVREELTDPEYWVRQVRQGVQFDAALSTLRAEKIGACLEVGPGTTLLGLGRTRQQEQEGALWLASLKDGRGDWDQLLDSLARLYVHGAAVDWKAFDRGYVRYRVALPTYPFQRQRYWIDTSKSMREPFSSAEQGTQRPDPLNGGDEAIDDWFYEVQWQAQNRPDPSPTPAVREGGDGAWLILADQGGVALKLAQRLAALGQEPVLLYRDTLPLHAAPPYRRVAVTAGDAPALRGALEAQTLACGKRELGLVYLWGLDEHERPEGPADGVMRATWGAVQLVQALTDRQRSPRQLWLATRQAQQIDGDAIEASQTPLWALGGVIANEHPQLHCMRVDLPAAADADGLAQLLESELLAADGGAMVAYRNGQRFAPRLARHKAVDRPALPAGPFRIGIEQYGVLDDLCLVPVQRRAPGAGQVEVRVASSGLNFKEVVFALGMMPDYVPADPRQMTFGLEFSGTVCAVGSGTDGLRVGDEVFGIFPGSMATHVTLDAARLMHKPSRLSLQEAAGVPAVFLTSHFGLDRLAALRAGESVLIHTAAGGVGQAALQLALRAGAIVYATASPGKWEFLKAQGVAHVMHSRTLDFSAELLELTGGRGVDVVLNTLVGEFVPKSLDVLAPGGRFIELGKRGVWAAGEVAAYRPDVRYFPLDLGEMMEQQPSLYREMLLELTGWFEDGQLRALPATYFDVGRAAQAFRYLAQGKNIGKVIVDLPTAAAQGGAAARNAVRPDRCYLLTGGLGALGLEVARHLVARGARHLVLVARRDPGQLDDTLAQLRSGGVRVVVKSVDVAVEAEVQALIDDIGRTEVPLGGVIHAAGLVGGGSLQQQEAGGFADVLRPKVAGTWHLHRWTRTLPLDFFVCFSSVTTMELGGTGHSAYAAANAYMDALMHSRRSEGLPALSINWGAWGEAGMVARLSGEQQSRVTVAGIQMIKTAQGLKALARLMDGGFGPQIAVMPIDWPLLLQTLPNAGQGFFDRLRSSGRNDTPGQGQSDVVDELARLPQAERMVRLRELVRLQIARVLQLSSPDKVGAQDKLFDLGFDSLMAVELKNRLQAALRCTLLPTLLFDYPTLQALTNYLAHDVLQWRAEAAEEKPAGKARGVDQLAANVAALSEAEAEAMLMLALDGETEKN